MTFQFGKFRKLPVQIEAAQYPGLTVGGEGELRDFEDWLDAKAAKAGRGKCFYRGQQLIIPTLEGQMAANPGDWIIVGVAGELYPCAREIFAQTYVRAQSE